MQPRYEIQIGRSLQEAWQLFLLAPEIFTVLTLFDLFAIFALGWIPGLGLLLNLAVGALALPAFFLIADRLRTQGRASFGDLRELMHPAPQLLAIFVLKSIFLTVGFALLFLPGLFLATIYLFAELFALLHGRTFWEAMEASRRLAQANWFGCFGLLAFCGILAFSGALLAGIGLLLTVPLAALVLYSAFRQITA